MKRLLILGVLLAAIAVTGCVSKAKYNERAREAFIAGQQQAMAAQAQANSVWVVGNVQTSVIPWTEDLTLVQTLIAANYRGRKDPSQIIIRRNGAPPTTVTAKQLFNGFDMPLQAGDRVEVRP